MPKLNVRPKGRPLPAGMIVPDALSSIREAARRSFYKSGQSSSSSWNLQAGTREMMNLGKLMYRWPDIVGPDLARHSYPFRLIKGSLQLICSDSQWLQTLQFVKESIKKKIETLFSDLRIRNLFGKVGVIPKEVHPPEPLQWPEWTEQPEPLLPEKGTSPELREAVIRCEKKMTARLKGMEARGFTLCPKCQGNLVAVGIEKCAVCVFYERRADYSRAKALVNETPWATLEDIQEIVPWISSIERDLMREELLDETRDRIMTLAQLLEADPDGELRHELRREISRAVLFKTGLMPHEIDLSHPHLQEHLELNWMVFLQKFEEETPC